MSLHIKLKETKWIKNNDPDCDTLVWNISSLLLHKHYTIAIEMIYSHLFQIQDHHYENKINLQYVTNK